MSDAVALRLPKVLRDEDDDAAVDVLQEYFTRKLVKTGYLRTGALWDTFDPSGRRDIDRDVVTADDLVAVTLLSVKIPAQGALILLGDKSAELTSLLREVGEDRDLAVESDPITDESPMVRLEAALTEVHGIGRTTATKLVARKRPRLFPIYDRVIGLQLGTTVAHTEPIRAALRENDGALHGWLVELRAKAGFDEGVPALRILDVLAWMQGKKYVPNVDG
ncbi:DUF6308 family protein [Rhodococcus gannanensis]|uniref:DUF6308 family protein n=1 Tax=Rhodococcus gannanensis TaxID=1960308 RepID=A0ABW4PA04_9NOCA